MKNIGYACLNLDVNSKFKTCRLQNLTPEKQKELIKHNLDALKNILLYNEKHQLRLFRISSDIIPFGSSVHNKIHWQAAFEKEFEELGEIIVRSEQRISMHPGQYTVLNSPTQSIVDNAVRDLQYHYDLLQLLAPDKNSNIVLHAGGGYGDKQAALNRFEKNFNQLPEKVASCIVLENDDRIFNIEEVLSLGQKLSCPVVYDNLHNQVNPSPHSLADSQWIAQAAFTWKNKVQKVHYSQQDSEKQPGSHSQQIYAAQFMAYFENLPAGDLDIMLEVKDKNRSALKCNALVNPSPKLLQEEWARYKYWVMERSPGIYQQIRNLFRKPPVSAMAFYELVQAALSLEENKMHRMVAAEHVWGYVKDQATPKEKQQFQTLKQSYLTGEKPLSTLKTKLYDLAKKYQQQYLLDSYYFK